MKFTIVLILLMPLFGTQAVAGGEIALTFDDAPMPGTEVMTGAEKTQRLIKALAKAKAPPALFFVTTKHLNEESATRLEQYAAAGHYLANHSHEHLSANQASVHDFLVDAYRAHLLLKPFERVLPLFRFPYLHYGQTPETRNQLAAGLAELGYGIGYVTVDNFDWYIDSLYREAVKNDNVVIREKLGKLYVETLWQAIQFYDDLAVKTLGRSPKHVLLLHENDLAATYIGDLIQHIRAQGWTIISPVEAYQDPIALTTQDFAFSKQGRIAALAAAGGANIEKLRHESESTDYIDALFSEMGVVKTSAKPE